MSQPVVVVGTEDTVEEVARLMRERGARCVAVVDADGRCAGVIREQEFTLRERHLPFSATESAPQLFGEWIDAKRVEEGYAEARARRAREVMVPGDTTTEEARLTEVLPRLQHGHVLLVVRDGRPVGTVSRHELLKLLDPRWVDERRP